MRSDSHSRIHNRTSRDTVHVDYTHGGRDPTASLPPRFNSRLTFVSPGGRGNEISPTRHTKPLTTATLFMNNLTSNRMFCGKPLLMSINTGYYYNGLWYFLEYTVFKTSFLWWSSLSPLTLLFLKTLMYGHHRYHIYCSKRSINRVRLPILLVVSRTGTMDISLSPFAPENLVSRDGFGRSLPSLPGQEARKPKTYIFCLLAA